MDGNWERPRLFPVQKAGMSRRGSFFRVKCSMDVGLMAGKREAMAVALCLGIDIKESINSSRTLSLLGIQDLAGSAGGTGQPEEALRGTSLWLLLTGT